MTHTARSAVDSRSVPELGYTRNGLPLSYNRAPASDLADWIARLGVIQIDLPPGETLSCGLFSETPSLRVQLAGDCEVETLAGLQQHQARNVLFCGPQSRLRSLRVTSSIVSLIVALRPSACNALIELNGPDLVDRVISPPDDCCEHILSLINPAGTPEDWLVRLEGFFRDHLATLPNAEPDPVTAHFEKIAFRDPAMSISQAAREIGVDRRRLERLVSRDFGMPPKQVLKRARALDMASFLRGVADKEEGQAFALRYYDESHLIREFTELFGMPPGRFKALAQPLLTSSLDARQARRLETLERLAPGAKRPWE
ncbi:helix-turn-helix domain-containing protein [Novosphingobium sp. RD2P27]|uniref:Helix-turn-helix domain-containing protein n=1 Tax=Novosphingobium kalidii TaxID=3230299 RepID=A0ABV2CWS4_9SPHN